MNDSLGSPKTAIAALLIPLLARSGRSRSRDDALGKAFNPLFNADFIRSRRPRSGIEAVEISNAGYVELFKCTAPKGDIDYASPLEWTWPRTLKNGG